MASSTEDLAHVYLVDCGLDLGHEELQFVCYDDATQQLLVVKGNHVFAYDVTAGGALKWMYPLQVRGMRGRVGGGAGWLCRQTDVSSTSTRLLQEPQTTARAAAAAAAGVSSKQQHWAMQWVGYTISIWSDRESYSYGFSSSSMLSSSVCSTAILPVRSG